MKAPSPIAVIRSVLGPEQAEALLRGGVAPESLARTVLEATAPADLAATLAAAGLEKAEPLSARTVLAVQNLVRLNQMRADRAIREVALGKAEKAQKVLRVDLGDLSHHAHTADGRVHRVFSDRNGTVDETSSQTFDAEGKPHVSTPDDAKTVSRHVQAALDYRKKVHSKAAPTGSIARAMNRQSDKVLFRKAERSPKLPPDQHGIGPKHEPEEKIAPTKQLEPQVHQNHGAKRPPAALEKRSKNVKEQMTGITSILKSDVAEWRSRPVLRAEHAQDLDHAAAARSLSSGSAQEGERQAYEEYSRQQRLDAMAHHFRQAGEAQKRGDRLTSDRHMLAYAGHARALGIDPAGHPPPEVGERIRQLAGKRAAFRGHPADRLA